MRNKKGLTFLEVLIILIFLATLVVAFFIQQSSLAAAHRDDERKTSINAIYYALEESFYPTHGYYPEYISESNLTVIDPSSFTDPSGYQLGDPVSSYSYRPANCYLGHCQEYILSSTLELEETYSKYSRTTEQHLENAPEESPNEQQS